MDRVLKQLSDFAFAFSYADLPEDVVERAKHIILDTVGCALGAAHSPPARIARAAAAEVTAPALATVMVSGRKTSPDLAAFANGVMIRYLDFNDTYPGEPTGHPSDLLAPVVAAVETTGGGGRDAILGLVLAYDVMCGLIDCGKMSRGEGWDQSTYGAIAAAAAAGKLLGLNKKQLAHAISLTISSHVSLEQVRRGQISHWKGCAVANASRNALFCARLAAKGMTGPDEAFEGIAGFIKSTGIEFDLARFGEAVRPHRIMRARIKTFPSGYFSQSAIEAVLELRPQIANADEIKEVRLQTFPSGYRVMGSSEAAWKPETRESADHSLPFVMAVALMEGGVEIRHYEEEYYLRPDVRALMQKISVRVGEEPVAAWPEVPLNIVDIELNSGNSLSTRVAFHLGHFERLMTDEQLERKFRSLVAPLLPPERIDSLLTALRRLDELERIDDLISLTIAPGST